MALKQNLTLAGFSVIFALLVGEVALRILAPEHSVPQKPKSDWAIVPERIWTEYHPELGWYHQRNKTAESLKEGSFKVTVHTNSRGFRGTREYAESKPPGTVRMLVLGDSFPFGFGVEDDQTFPALLEQQSPNLEVPNLGVPGYGLDQMLIAYRVLGKKLHPDYVVIGVFWEDFWRCTRAFVDTGHAKPYFVLNAQGQLQLHNVPAPQPFQLTTNQFPPILEYSPVEQFFLKSYFFRILQRSLTRLGKMLGLIDPDTTPECQVGRAILRQLIREIRQAGSKPILMMIPPDRWITDKDTASLLKSMRLFAQSEKVPMIDMLPVLKEAVRNVKISDFYIPNDRHWTLRGHELAAAEIQKFLTSQQVRPESGKKSASIS